MLALAAAHFANGSPCWAMAIPFLPVVVVVATCWALNRKVTG